jgi:hypothetical protein
MVDGKRKHKKQKRINNGKIYCNRPFLAEKTILENRNRSNCIEFNMVCTVPYSTGTVRHELLPKKTANSPKNAAYGT